MDLPARNTYRGALPITGCSVADDKDEVFSQLVKPLLKGADRKFILKGHSPVITADGWPLHELKASDFIPLPARCPCSERQKLLGIKCPGRRAVPVIPLILIDFTGVGRVQILPGDAVAEILFQRLVGRPVYLVDRQVVVEVLPPGDFREQPVPFAQLQLKDA